MAADGRQIASVLLGLISSLLAWMQLNVALLNPEISYTRRRLDVCKLFTLSTGQNGRHKQLKRVGKHCCPRRFWVKPGRTSAWWDNFVNPQWNRSESEYVWTGEFGMNTLWSHNVWTRIFPYRERKSCGFKNILMRVDGALVTWWYWGNLCNCFSQDHGVVKEFTWYWGEFSKSGKDDEKIHHTTSPEWSSILKRGSQLLSPDLSSISTDANYIIFSLKS